ncbi:hypothetical protein ASF61_16020 [Duganella sp. Leaf126]|uniref:GIN domain-containing protein n=1 Tax=Duganella sp. Leaf126 TaxID=1736266 RepID=UPI0006FFDC21|nr:DUF2807 domain-containing protein [Duganella sp. Leaf126]KQQ31860.1 hypothetical protein ASF61_16020 [Duganella sp. Leaf126]
MKRIFQFGLLFAATCALFGRAVAADEGGETRTVDIDARVVRIRVDGMVDVRLRQGPVPSLTIRGDKRYMDRLTSSQSGDTLHFDTDGGRGIKLDTGHGARAEMVLPDLRQVVVEGLGSTDISGFAGQDLELVLDGAGSIKANVDYKSVRAKLGGVGKMTLWISENERTVLDLGGAGNIVLGGRGKLLKVDLGGLGSLNAQQFSAENVEVDLSGLGNATVNASANAKLGLSGLGSVTVYGKPRNRDVSVDGLGKVNWK